MNILRNMEQEHLSITENCVKKLQESSVITYSGFYFKKLSQSHFLFH